MGQQIAMDGFNILFLNNLSTSDKTLLIYKKG